MFGYRIKQMQQKFFTAAAVIAAVDKTTRRALSMFGAFVRTRARSSMRRRKGVSNPGSPPNAHLGLIKQFLFFAYEDRTRSVVIGPALLNGTVAGSNAMAALEYGGPSIEVNYDKNGARKYHTTTVRAFPFMRPARDKELPGLSRIWDKGRK